MIKYNKLQLTLINSTFIFGVLACNIFSLPQVNDNQSQRTVNQNADFENQQTQIFSENMNSLTLDNDEDEETINLDNLADYEFPQGVDTYRITMLRTFNTSKGESRQIMGDGLISMAKLSASLTILTEGTYWNEDNELDYRILDPLIFRSVNRVDVSSQGDVCNVIDTNVGVFQDFEKSLTAHHQSYMPSRLLTGTATLSETNVMINDRLTNLYVLDLSNFDQDEFSLMHFSSIDQANLYLDIDTNSLVRIVVEGQGEARLINLANPEMYGTITYEINLLEFNKPVEIDFLPECKPEAKTQFPVPELVLFIRTVEDDTSLEIITQISVEEASVFYKEELKLDNWSLYDESSFGAGSLILKFKNLAGEILMVDLYDLNANGDKGDVMSTHITVGFTLIP